MRYDNADLQIIIQISGGKIPADQMTTVNKQFKISLGLFGFFCAADVLGIIMAVAFLTFNINNSEHRYWVNNKH